MKTPDDLFLYEMVSKPILEHLKALPNPDGFQVYAWGTGGTNPTVGVMFLRGESLARVLAYMATPEFNAPPAARPA